MSKENPEPAEFPLDGSATNENAISPKKQFGIAAMFWITFIIGLVIAYLDQLGSSPDREHRFSPESESMMLVGALVAIAIGGAIGFVIGKLTGKLSDAMFWGTLVAAFGYISTAPIPGYIVGHRLAWASVGAVSGAIGATMFLNRWWIRALACALGGGVPMIIYYFVGGNRLSHDVRIDMNAAPFIGVCVCAFVSGLLWLESKQKMPRYITATWLMVSVILGNLFSW